MRLLFLCSDGEGIDVVYAPPQKLLFLFPSCAPLERLSHDFCSVFCEYLGFVKIKPAKSIDSSYICSIPYQSSNPQVTPFSVTNAYSVSTSFPTILAEPFLLICLVPVCQRACLISPCKYLCLSLESS